MLTSGWKSTSMVDVRGKVTFTLWLCGCNLKCPFCHNWRIAEGEGCFPLDEGLLLEELEYGAFLLDYFHITGGEPLMQWRELPPEGSQGHWRSNQSEHEPDPRRPVEEALEGGPR